MNLASEAVNVRGVRKEDAPLLAEIFAGLSPASRAARYLAPKRAMSVAELTYFTDIDHHNHEALIAIWRLTDEPVGVVHFVRDGSLLASRVSARARRECISQFTALMATDNHRARRLLAKVGCVTQVARDGATAAYRLTLIPPTPLPRTAQTAPARTPASQ